MTRNDTIGRDVSVFLFCLPGRMKRRAGHSLQQPRGAELPPGVCVPETEHPIGAARDEPWSGRVWSQSLARPRVSLRHMHRRPVTRPGRCVKYIPVS